MKIKEKGAYVSCGSFEFVIVKFVDNMSGKGDLRQGWIKVLY